MTTTALIYSQYWMGRDKQYPDEFTDEIKKNGMETVDKVNQLLRIWGGFTQVTSGWRPQAVNAATKGAAKKSNHTLALACDLLDRSGNLDAWCLANSKVLEDIGLWQEDPASTEGWCHLQTVPPKSGRRVFKP